MTKNLLVFSDDWGRHPSSCQHLVQQLLPRFDVYWINTIGTRLPSLDRETVARGLEKMRRWRRPEMASGGSANPRVLDPLMWPSFRGRWGRRLNRTLLARTVTRVLPEGEPTVAVTTLPLVADLVGRTPVDRWVYYCVDDLSRWPGLDRTTLERMERDLVGRVDAIVAVSDFLVRRMADLGKTAELLTHGVDVEHWEHPGPGDPPALAGLPRPLAVFWGVVDRRLDTDWLRRLSRDMESGSIVLIGPANDLDPELARLDRVVRIGPLPYEELPRVGRAADILIMPYADLAATRAMQPLKLKEYLATGRPVVASQLPAVEEWREACDVVGDAAAFSAAVRRRIAGDVPDRQRRARRKLDGETWAAKARTFEQLLAGKR